MRSENYSCMACSLPLAFSLPLTPSPACAIFHSLSAAHFILSFSHPHPQHTNSFSLLHTHTHTHTHTHSQAHAPVSSSVCVCLSSSLSLSLSSLGSPCVGLHVIISFYPLHLKELGIIRASLFVRHPSHSHISRPITDATAVLGDNIATAGARRLNFKL